MQYKLLYLNNIALVYILILACCNNALVVFFCKENASYLTNFN